MHQTYLLLGSNLGDRAGTLARAAEALEHSCGRLLGASAVYETAAWGVPDQPPFLNQVLCLQTNHSPQAVLECAWAAEKAANRVRQERWGARTLDVDILLYDAAVVATAALQIPHPALPQRRFALVPLAELAPDLLHPTLHQSISQLLHACPDSLPVTRYAP